VAEDALEVDGVGLDEPVREEVETEVHVAGVERGRLQVGDGRGDGAHVDAADLVATDGPSGAAAQRVLDVGRAHRLRTGLTAPVGALGVEEPGVEHPVVGGEAGQADAARAAVGGNDVGHGSPPYLA
jgi:hypothetical protein